MIDRIVVFILDRESTDLFCKIRLNCQNAVSERMVKLIAQIFKICVVAADGIVLELPAAETIRNRVRIGSFPVCVCRLLVLS